MKAATATDAGEVRDLVGQTLGPSDWRVVSQAMIDSFAELSGDHQWIHVDGERAEAESPFGGTVAHGDLTLAAIDGYREHLLRFEGFTLGVNYGWNKIRFPAPVPAGARIRASVEVLAVDDVGAGWVQVVQRWTVEVDGADKPACVADSVVRLLE